MPKPLPALDSSLLLPPVSPTQYRYFENAQDHPFRVDEESPSLRNAWWMAECSLAAYAEPEMAEEIFTAGGLRIADGGVISGPSQGGRCFVLESDGAIIVAFRGTQTVKEEQLANIEAIRKQWAKVMRDVTTDAKVVMVPWSGRAGGNVHKGFADSLGEMLAAIRAVIASLRRPGIEHKLWITGHSLGAALATLAADVLEGVHGIHTFGSPQVGDEEFANNVALKGWRIRNHADGITWAPSRLLGYRHVRPGFYFDRKGEFSEEPDAAGLLLDWLKGVPANLGDVIDSLHDGHLSGLAPEAINDHAPIFYCTLTWNAYEALGT